jgi:putative transposase
MKSSRLQLRHLSHVSATACQVIQYTATWFALLFRSKHELAAEIVALRSQLALYQLQQEKGIVPKPRCTPAFRLTWILLVKAFTGWKDALCIVKPETVIRWHRNGFRLFWRHKSRHRSGRPEVSLEMQRLIRKIHSDNPLWSPERIYDQVVDLGFDPPSPNTIRKHLPKPSRGSRAPSQTWKTFIANHMDVTWSMDLFAVPTITFRLLYVFIILSHERREIVQFGITQHPTMLWLVQQLREATGFGVQPRYVIHDNDKVYDGGVPAFLKSCGIEEVRTAFKSPWQNPYSERMVGTLRRELLNNIIPLNEKHLQRLLAEYIGKYYHPVRTHTSLSHKPPLFDLSIKKRQLSPDSMLESEPILGGLYHNYRGKAA